MTKANITRTLIETTLNKVLRTIESDPARTIRNIMDFAEDFSKGRFQKKFFEAAQSMLKNDDSTYYTLAQNAVFYVNHQTLKTFVSTLDTAVVPTVLN